MIQGTMSNAGKSLLCAGLCRIFKQDGYKVAPFKSQNMALNSFITDKGLEMGRAQVVQAEAAGIEPEVSMNPILLKPTNDVGSQVIVNGEVLGNMSARDYFKYKKELIPDVMKAFHKLEENYDIIVIEGAGSPAEINLKENDIVNMGLAKMVDAPVLLVGDIDRGGVFAQLLGTLLLLEEDEKERVKGLIINKFRGDKTILDPGIEMLEEKGNVPVIGVTPYLHVEIEDEDSLTERFTSKKSGGLLDIAVIRTPRISNFTDFMALENIPEVSLRYVKNVSEFGTPDMIILPGTKNTMGDMEWLIESGLEGAIIRAARTTRVIGICGGFQLLGKEMHDPDGVEHGGDMRGLGLLDTKTIFKEAKTRTRIHGHISEEHNIYNLDNLSVEGYEIHMGTTENLGEAIPMITLEDGRTDAYMTKDGRVWGSYLHGIFDNEDLVFALVQDIMKEKGINPAENHLSIAEYKEIQYNKLADLIRNSLDMDAIYKVLFGEKKEMVRCAGKKDDTSGKGLVHIYCGDGKGKTTTSVGLTVRAAGSGKKVLFYQFLKDNSSSERNILEKVPGITLVRGREMQKFTFQMNEQELDELRIYNNEMLDKLFEMAKDYDMLVMDESVYAIKSNLLDEEKLITHLEEKPVGLEVVLAGRNPSQKLMDHADYVSEIQKVKHPFDQGVSSRVGIEL